jgi:hypothetical protein
MIFFKIFIFFWTNTTTIAKTTTRRWTPVNQTTPLKMGLRAEQRILTWGIPNGREAPEKMFNILNHQGMQIKTTLRFHLTPVRMAKTKNSSDT